MMISDTDQSVFQQGDWQPTDRPTGSSFSFLPVAYYDPCEPLPMCSVSPALCRGICEGDCDAVEGRC